MILYKSPTSKEKYSEIEQVEILYDLEIDHIIYLLILSDKERRVPINLN